MTFVRTDPTGQPHPPPGKLAIYAVASAAKAALDMARHDLYHIRLQRFIIRNRLEIDEELLREFEQMSFSAIQELLREKTDAEI